MVDRLSPAALASLLAGQSPFALIDVREPGEYNTTHISDSSLIPRRHLELQMSTAVPVQNALVVLCDDDGRRANLAAATLERMGYTNVAVLDGGINRWATQGSPTEWGSNVISKEFGEKMEAVHHVPEIEATELHERIARGDKLVILDTRTPEEYQRFCIPGGRSVPGGELALRITDITKDLDKDTTVIVNCAGRTRSIIGTRVLQRMGFTNVYGLKNGTSGWVLAGYALETGADRLGLPAPSPEGLAAAEAYADRLASEDASATWICLPCRRCWASETEPRPTSSMSAHSRSMSRGTSPAFGGSPADRWCSAPTTCWWSSTARSSLPATKKPGPLSLRPGIASLASRKSTWCKAARRPGPPPAWR